MTIDHKPLETIYVAIIEDDRDIREGLTLLIDGSEGYRCVAAYGSCEQALPEIESAIPDVLLLDISLPGISGIEGLPALKKLMPELNIIMLTVHNQEQLIFDALCAGACGYLLKTTPPLQLLKAIREIYQGGAPMSRAIARRVIQSFRRQNNSDLSPREIEILELLSQGFSYQVIANKLFISHGTVHYHIKNIYRKLAVSSNAEAVARALAEKII